MCSRQRVRASTSNIARLKKGFTSRRKCVSRDPCPTVSWTWRNVSRTWTHRGRPCRPCRSPAQWRIGAMKKSLTSWRAPGMTLPMLFPDRAIDELNRASKLPGMRGVYMGTNINQRDLDDPVFEPIFARIEALELPVFLHPLQVVGGPRTAPFNLSNILSFPFDTGIAACHLIFGGVLDRHPKLQVTLPHGGGVLLMLIGRIDHGARVRPEIQKLGLPQLPSKYLQRFTFDTIVHSKSVMEFVISEVGAERIMIGSDYCLDMGYERPVHFLDQVNITSAQRKMILGENAARILKL